MCVACEFYTQAASRLPAYDPGIGPDPSGLPLLDKLGGFVGGFMVAALILSVGIIVGGAIAWGTGAVTNNPQLSSAGKKAILAGAVGAFIIGGASGLVAWFSSRA